MKSKVMAYWSLGISIVSLLVSIIALVEYHPTENLQFDYIGAIVGILALLITALIGAQVGQYIFVDKKIESITSKITRIIARKAAKEVAMQEARTELKSLSSDISTILKGKDLARESEIDGNSGSVMSCVDLSIRAIDQFSACNNHILYHAAVSDSLQTLQSCFEYAQGNGGVRILEGHKDYYISVLHNIREIETSLQEEYVKTATERPMDYDEYLLAMTMKGLELSACSYKEWKAQKPNA